MKAAEKLLLGLAAQYPDTEQGMKSIIYCCSRLKSPDSMIRKLSVRGLPTTPQAALNEMYDAVGMRVVCAFAEDVYRIVEWLKSNPALTVVQEKDYFSYPKPNGYRSYHLQVEVIDSLKSRIRAEVQVRTIATDFWATLEHQMKYKRELPHERLIRDELKRCADEIASVDLSMQTIRDILKVTKAEMCR